LPARSRQQNHRHHQLPRSPHCYFHPDLDTAIRRDHFCLHTTGLRTIVSLARKENSTMRRINLLLRITPSRIQRRLAEIVAIAAASLPAAGA
jgi:hypothetical protein